jgi:hypothetical protein
MITFIEFSGKYLGVSSFISSVTSGFLDISILVWNNGLVFVFCETISVDLVSLNVIEVFLFVNKGIKTISFKFDISNINKK